MKLKALLLVLLITALAIAAYFTFPWVALYIGLKLSPDPPSPEITYGEFPFRLEYEINGKRVAVQDTLICEYDGIGMDEGQDKYREWKEHLASGNEKILLLKIDDTKEIYYNPGPARYYMGDIEEYERYEQSFPDASFIENSGRFTEDGIISADELFNKYHIKLISWDYTEPITNRFSTSKK